VSSSAAADLYRTAVLWAVDQTGVEPVVRAACDALVAGLDGDALRGLAALSVRADEYDAQVADVVRAALAEQNMPIASPESPEAEEAAITAMAQEAVAGKWIPRELAAWAHRVVGHSGIQMAQPLVDLDDRYDCAQYIGETVASIDAEVLDYCRSITDSSDT
jgi:hypothetical protein